jgi:hypothetical protein
MNNIIGKTSDGREIRERQDYSLPGHCAECGQHVDPYDPAVWSHLTDTGLEERTDGYGLRDDEELAVRGESQSMGSETLDDSPGGRLGDTPAPGEHTRESLKARVRWDGSCIFCGAAADRVGQVESAENGRS